MTEKERLRKIQEERFKVLDKAAAFYSSHIPIAGFKDAMDHINLGKQERLELAVMTPFYLGLSNPVMAETFVAATSAIRDRIPLGGNNHLLIQELLGGIYNILNRSGKIPVVSREVNETRVRDYETRFAKWEKQMNAKGRTTEGVLDPYIKELLHEMKTDNSDLYNFVTNHHRLTSKYDEPKIPNTERTAATRMAVLFYKSIRSQAEVNALEEQSKIPLLKDPYNPALEWSAV